MSLKTILQNELRKKGRLYVNDVMEISIRENHYFDTARRKLEPKDTPFAKKHIVGNRIKWWDYLPENDGYNGISPADLTPHSDLEPKKVNTYLNSKQESITGLNLPQIRI
jgi:hypothetical protein